MKSTGARQKHGIIYLVIVILAIPMILWSQPATLNGIVTNSVSNIPVIGAKITVNGQSTFSVSGGIYSLSINPTGTFTATCVKTGFDPYTSSSITFTSGVTVTLNISLQETANPPGNVTATLDTVTTPKVQIDWQIPVGNYEILYDDGLQDDFTVWAIQGNMNAMKFTPAGYPAKVTGGSVNIGSAGNYPAGSNPFVPFQMVVYNANGPGGTPGTALTSPIDVLPSAFGWISYTFPTPPTINSGNFYIVMIQGGNAPNAAGLAIDLTIPKFRSYQKFATGAGPWVIADGNFLIRAIVNGPGGPLEQTDAPESIVNYQVWRLKQGEELNPVVWTSVGIQATTNLTDYSWPSLPCGPYRWAVETQYSGNRWSPASFSNIIGKCWTAHVGVNVSMSCAAANPNGTKVSLKNLVYADTIYSATLDSTGSAIFPKVWKGAYELKITNFNYQTYITNPGISHDTIFNIVLLQNKIPPSNLTVNGKTLVAHWKQPQVSVELFNENWSSGNFSANGWTIEGGYNWVVSQTTGNPPPSAMFGWSPQVTNYSQSLISKSFTGENSSVLKLKYDIYLNNFGTTTVNQMAVELWDGTTWHLLKNYDNTKGSFPWTSEILDISAYTNMTFKIRFRAYGGDTYDINSWNIDNIRIWEEESPSNIAACILGYNFYVNNVLSCFVTDTTYTIPATLVQYGQTYSACVEAVYASGYSSKICTNFTSTYLDPPTNLTGIPIEDVAYLTWDKPVNATVTGPPPGLTGYYIYRDGLLHDSISNPDTLDFYDYGLDPGTYTYAVSAKYDLTPYGYSGLFDQSMQDGPDTVILDYGLLLPFFEPWDQGNFTYNNWSFTSSQGNWLVNTVDGNPAPSAQFNWEPPLNNYTCSLQSPVLTATNIHCATVWLDFDYTLKDHNMTSHELLTAEIYYSNKWHKVSTYVNNGDIPWTSQHFDISIVKGKPFRVRFTAQGMSSTDILYWEVDNIHVYGICNPARDLTGDAQGYDVLLTWNPPDCSANGNILDEGFEELQFPPPDWTQIITNAAATWSHADTSSYFGVHSGNYSAGLIWDYNHQDEWLIAHDMEVTGDLKFWSFVHPGSVHLDHYYVKVSTDHGTNWTVLLDMSSLPPYPGTTGYNKWNEPYTVNMSAYTGEVVDIAWQAVDGDNLGLWYAWAIDDCRMGSKKFHSSSLRKTLTGYDIYREIDGSGSFLKIMSLPSTDTSYVDPSLPAGQYNYFVNAISDECSQLTSTDTITVDVITSLRQNDKFQVNIYPNPANDKLFITSQFLIKRIELIDFLGQTVYFNTLAGRKEQIALSALKNGIYLVKVTTDQGICTVKVTVTR